MKKLTALLMSIVMLAGLIVGTSASGEILWYDDFSEGFSSDDWLTDGNLFFLDDSTDPDNPCLAAYKDGVVSQSHYMYDLTPTPRGYSDFVMSARVNLREHDGDGSHMVGFWWIDDFHYVSEADGGNDGDSGPVYQYVYNDDEGYVALIRAGAIVGKTDMRMSIGEGEWFTMGWRVVPGRIVCYIDGAPVIEYIADDIVSEGNSPIILYNSKCYVAFDDITLATSDYDLFDETAMTFAVEADDVRVGDTTVNANIVVTLPEDATGYELGAFRVDLDYDRSVMSLASAPDWKVQGGLTISGDKLTTVPYPMAWATVDTPAFKAGKNVIASVTFNLAKPATEDSTYEIGLSIDRAVQTGNLPVSLASQDGTHTEFSYIREQIALQSDIVGVHKYTSVVTAPTCEDKGYTTYTCDCGDSYVDDYVDALGHSYTDVVTPPTRTEQGYTTHTCGTCGDSYVDTYVDPIASIPGDVNDDGDVSLADVTLLLKHLAGWDVTINADAADVNDDGDVSLADATLLMKYLASWDVVLK